METSCLRGGILAYRRGRVWTGYRCIAVHMEMSIDKGLQSGVDIKMNIRPACKPLWDIEILSILLKLGHL